MPDKNNIIHVITDLEGDAKKLNCNLIFLSCLTTALMATEAKKYCA